MPARSIAAKSFPCHHGAPVAAWRRPLSSPHKKDTAEHRPMPRPAHQAIEQARCAQDITLGSRDMARLWYRGAALHRSRGTPPPTRRSPPPAGYRTRVPSDRTGDRSTHAARRAREHATRRSVARTVELSWGAVCPARPCRLVRSKKMSGGHGLTRRVVLLLAPRRLTSSYAVSQCQLSLLSSCRNTRLHIAEKRVWHSGECR